MKYPAFAALISLLVLAVPSVAATKAAQLREIDGQYKQALALRKQMLSAIEFEDVRGRHAADDARDWVISDATADRVRTLRNQVKSRDAQVSGAAIIELGTLVGENLARAQMVNDYWFKAAPAPFWRRNWRAFATANNLPPEPTDPKVLEIDARMVAQLNAGDFQQAVKLTAPELNLAIRAMVGDARRTLAKQRQSADLVFIPHKNPCISPAERSRAPGDFYPPGARHRGEEGTVILRTRVNADSCGLATAIVVSTGFRELDEAGLLTAEYTRFAAGTDNGKPIASEVTYGVKFIIED